VTGLSFFRIVPSAGLLTTDVRVASTADHPFADS
jgi:hypothetical protein